MIHLVIETDFTVDSGSDDEVNIDGFSSTDYPLNASGDPFIGAAAAAVGSGYTSGWALVSGTDTIRVFNYVPDGWTAGSGRNASINGVWRVTQ